MLKVVDGGANEHNARSGNVYRYTLTYKRIPVYTYVHTYILPRLQYSTYVCWCGCFNQYFSWIWLMKL